MENRFIRAEDVAQELNVSKPYAYKLIRQLNEEFERGSVYLATKKIGKNNPKAQEIEADASYISGK